MCEYSATGRSAGEEGSSTYEGRYLTIVESELRHPYHSDGYVNKGDPVVHTTSTGHIVGVAMKDAAAATDLIAIDTEGIWYLTVLDKNDAGNSAVAAGDQIFINTGTDQTLGASLSKRVDFETQIPFGYALGAVSNSGSGGVCAVKVHNAPYFWDFYHSNATSTADDGMSLTVVDSGTSTGLGRGFYVNYTQTGDKAGGSEVDVIGADLTFEDDITYGYNVGLYQVGSGNPAIGWTAGISIYIDDLGTGVVGRTTLDLGKVTTHKASGRETFQRMKEFGTGGSNISTSVFLLESQNNSGIATYLVDFENGGGTSTPFTVAAVGGQQTAKIAVCLNGTPYYIPLYTA